MKRTFSFEARTSVWMRLSLLLLPLLLNPFALSAPLEIPFVTRGPYLQAGTQTNIVIRWRTDQPVPSHVFFGLTRTNLDRLASNLVPTTEHIVFLPDLTPQTRYFYAVSDGESILAGGPDYYFITAPSQPKPVRIWAIGDSGSASAGYPGSREVRDAYYEYAGNTPTDVWLMLGDNAYYTGTDAEYQEAVFDIFPTLLRNTVVWSTIGNHETYAPYPDGRFAYLDIFSHPEDGRAGGVPSGSPYYYSFDYANIHFICLDSEISIDEARGSMLAWLEADLANNTQPWTIAFWHSPPYTKGSHNSDDVFDSGGHLFAMRTNVVPRLEAYGVDLVLGGHSHNYERSYLLHGHYGTSDTLEPSMILDPTSGNPDEGEAYRKHTSGPSAGLGTVYVVAGSSGWATFTTGRHPAMYAQFLLEGSLVIDVQGDRLDAIFLRETGAIFDSFSIIKGAALAPFKIIDYSLPGNRNVLRWASEPGKFYQVEHTDELHPTQWQPISPVLYATGPVTSWTNSPSTPPGRAFYRVAEVFD